MSAILALAGMIPGENLPLWGLRKNGQQITYELRAPGEVDVLSFAIVGSTMRYGYRMIWFEHSIYIKSFPNSITIVKILVNPRDLDEIKKVYVKYGAGPIREWDSDKIEAKRSYLKSILNPTRKKGTKNTLLGEEKVRVPAGTFDCYKVSWRSSDGDNGIFYVDKKYGFIVKAISRNSQLVLLDFKSSGARSKLPVFR